MDIQGQSVQVAPFTPYNKRSKNHTNIYLKNLPGPSHGMTLEEVQSHLQKVASQQGEVSSLLVKFDDKFQKHFAFVCYKESEAAEKAYVELAKMELKD